MCIYKHTLSNFVHKCLFITKHGTSHTFKTIQIIKTNYKKFQLIKVKKSIKYTISNKFLLANSQVDICTQELNIM